MGPNSDHRGRGRRLQPGRVGRRRRRRGRVDGLECHGHSSVCRPVDGNRSVARVGAVVAQPGHRVGLKVGTAVNTDALADAFRWAHQADRTAVLYDNDDNLEGIGPKSDAVYRLVRRLRREGVPVQGIGLQTHLDTQYSFPEKMQFTMERFARLGVDVAITEADVRIPLPVGATEGLAQVADYSQTMQACLSVPRCVSYTVWGLGDAYSWVPAVFDGEGSADLYDENLAPKPAYYALQQDLRLAADAPPRPRSTG